MTKSPPGREKNRQKPDGRSKNRNKKSLLTEKGIPIAIEIDGENRHDVKLFESTMNNLIIKT